MYKLEKSQKAFKTLDLLRGSVTIDCYLFAEMINEKLENGSFNSSKFLRGTIDFNKLDKMLNDLSNEEIESLFFIILSNEKFNDNFVFPEGEKLVIEIIKRFSVASNSVLDIGSGYGSFINNLHQAKIGEEYYGEEINSNAFFISNILFKLRNIDNVSIKKQDSLLNWEDYHKYDIVYCNMPFLGSAPNDIKDIFDEMKKYPLPRVRTSDWFFNFRVIDSMKESGIGFSFVRNGALNGNRDEEIRKYFIENKKIKAVIKLPSNLLDYTMIPTNLLIFTNESNEKVKFIDASNKFVNLNRRKNGFSDENINDIIDGLFNENEIAKSIHIDEIKKEDYDLSPELYLNNYEDKLINPIKLSDLATIIRGRNINKNELDQDLAKPQGGFLLNIGDFQDSLIMKCKQSVSNELIEQNQKIIVQHKDILLIGRGPVIKVAMADKELVKQNVIVSSNITIIRANKEKINPYYLFAYLNSEIGLVMLNRISTGTVMNSVSNKKLNELLIPILSLDEQMDIAEEMNVSLSDYRRILKNLEKYNERLPLIFNKFSEGGE